MVKETYIYKELAKIFAANCTRKEKLDKVAVWTQAEYGIDLCFCKLLGKRWSFYAGSEELLVPQERVEINDAWGIFAENINENRGIWDEIVSALQKLIY